MLGSCCTPGRVPVLHSEVFLFGPLPTSSTKPVSSQFVQCLAQRSTPASDGEWQARAKAARSEKQSAMVSCLVTSAELVKSRMGATIQGILGSHERTQTRQTALWTKKLDSNRLFWVPAHLCRHQNRSMSRLRIHLRLPLSHKCSKTAGVDSVGFTTC